MPSDPTRPAPVTRFAAAGGEREQDQDQDRKKPSPADVPHDQDDELEEALEDSFPASDPPSITQPVHRHDEKDGDEPD